MDGMDDKEVKRESIRSNKSNKRPTLTKKESAASRATSKQGDDRGSASLKIEGEQEHFRETEKAQSYQNVKVVKEDSKVQAIPERRTESVLSSKRGEQDIDVHELKESSTLIEEHKHLSTRYENNEDLSLKQASSCTV